RAAYLAHFLRELANHSAWSKWYFSEFDSLRSLPAGAAIREALLREPSQAEAALLDLLVTNRLALVSACLTAYDQERVIACCAGGATWSAGVLKTVLQWAQQGSSRELTLLETYLRVRHELSGFSPGDAAGAAEHLSRIRSWARAHKLQEIVAQFLS